MRSDTKYLKPLDKPKINFAYSINYLITRLNYYYVKFFIK